MLPLLLVFVLVGFASPASDNRAKTEAKAHSKKAETLLKSGNSFEAYQEANAAVLADPENRKFREKLAQIAHAASRLAEQKAKEKMATDPQDARSWLQAALRYEPSNSSASQALSALDLQLNEISKKAQQVQEYLDSGNLSQGEELLNSIVTYKTAIPSIESLQKAVASETHLNIAEGFWSSGNPEFALRELTWAETASTVPLYVKNKSTDLRRKLSDYYVAKASAIPTATPSDLLDRADLLKRAKDINATNAEAIKMTGDVIDAFGNLLPKNPGGSMAPSPAIARVALEESRLLAKRVGDDAKLVAQKSAFSSLAYPILRVKLAVTGPSGCSSLIDPKTFDTIAAAAIGPTAVLDDRNWDVSVSIQT